MRIGRALIPKTLVARVYALYLVTLLAFLVSGLSVYYRVEFAQQIEEAHLLAETLMDVAGNTVSDSAVIGDYDTIKKTLDRSIRRSHFSVAEFIDVGGAIVRTESRHELAYPPPAFITRLVEERLYDVNRVVSVGGKDYGVLRMRFAADWIAADIWHHALITMSIALVGLVSGLVLIRIPLRRWLGGLDRMRAFEQDIQSGAIDARTLLVEDAPIELRQTLEILNRTAASLQAQRLEATTTLHAIADGVVTTDPDGRIAFCNPAALRMFGVGGETAVGRALAELLPGVRLDADWATRRIESGSGSSRRVLETTLSSIQTAGGGVAGHVLACRDVTDAHALDLKLREEFARRERVLVALQGILAGLEEATAPGGVDRDDIESLSARVAALLAEREASRRALDNQKFALDQHAIVSIADPEGRITYANDRFCEISGYARTELLGANHRLIRSDEHPDAFYAELWRTITAGRVWRGELKNRTKSGAHYWVSATIVPLTDRSGRIEQYIGIRTDITERKQAEAQLQDAKLAAEAANRAKSDFLANMSHEIRTPMNGIIGMTELALDTRLDATQRDYLQIVRSSAESLLVILNDILDFSKIEAGKLAIERIEYSLPTTIAETLKSISARARKKGLRLICDLPADLPSQVIGDPGRLRQILINFCDNAIKFTEHGEITVSAGFGHIDDTVREIRIAVSDTGIGIPADKASAIFEAFTQADASTTRRYGGTGLGLTICKRLVELMGGQISVESEFGRGSTFRFSVRVDAAPGSAPPLPPLTTWPGLRALIIDDHATNRRTLRHWLVAWGFAVDEAADGGHAVALCSAGAENPYRVLLLDAHLPDQDGFALAAELAAAGRTTGTAMLMLSSGGERGDAQRCRDLGIGAYLTKPATPLELREAITRLLDPVGDRDELLTRHRLREHQRCLDVLVVEDHPVNQRLAQTLLTGWGHRVTLAGNGREALDLFPTTRWDIVFMDMQMPVMGGLEATRAIRDLERSASLPRTPIIAMTANAMAEDRDQCLAAGMDEHLAKPLDVNAVHRLLGHFCAGVGRSQASPAAAPVRLEPENDAAIEAALDAIEPDIIDAVGGIFVEQIAVDVATARAAVGAADHDTLRRTAHNLKSTLATFGFRRLSEVARSIEASPQTATPALIDRLGESIERVTQVIRQRLPRSPE